MYYLTALIISNGKISFLPAGLIPLNFYTTRNSPYSRNLLGKKSFAECDFDERTEIADKQTLIIAIHFVIQKINLLKI